MTAYLARHEQFERVGSTNDIVRDWLAAGQSEVCLAVARDPPSVRGRAGRTWLAPPGAALLLSLGFRPTWLQPDRVWQLAAIASLAMADAVMTTSGIADGIIRLKWPNDIVVERQGDGLRKLGGILGETEGLGTTDPRVIIGIGVNTDWDAGAFPPDLAASMTSLREVAGGGASVATGLLGTFVDRLGDRLEALRAGQFDAAGWSSRQVTNGRMISLEHPDGAAIVRALGVDARTGALVVEDVAAAGGTRPVLVGEVTRVRLAGPMAVSMPAQA